MYFVAHRECADNAALYCGRNAFPLLAIVLGWIKVWKSHKGCYAFRKY
jgi:hypothetical protein